MFTLFLLAAVSILPATEVVVEEPTHVVVEEPVVECHVHHYHHHPDVVVEGEVQVK